MQPQLFTLTFEDLVSWDTAPKRKNALVVKAILPVDENTGRGGKAVQHVFVLKEAHAMKMAVEAAKLAW